MERRARALGSEPIVMRDAHFADAQSTRALPIERLLLSWASCSSKLPAQSLKTIAGGLLLHTNQEAGQ